MDGYLDAQCPAGPTRPACRRAAGRGTEYALLTHTVPGPAGSTAQPRYLNRYPDQATRSAIPTALVNFGVSVNFPLILAVLVALFGAATLVHVLTVSVSRPRREAGISQGTRFPAPPGGRRGVLAGHDHRGRRDRGRRAAGDGGRPGRLAGFAAYLGVVPVPMTPAWLLAGLAAGVLVAANALAITPAWLAGRAIARGRAAQDSVNGEP